MNVEATRRIADMRSYAAAVTRLVETRSLDEVLNHEALRCALCYTLFVIGEASIHVPEATRNAMPTIPWMQLRGLRNRLAHAYFSLDPIMIYVTATTSIPDLLDKLDNASPDEPGADR